jgi:AraC family transcriptional regulator
MSPERFAEELRRAEYAARFNRVVDHIQAHLVEAMDLETLAGVACFSPYHFHRLFHGWMGETIHDFIHRLRLERAAAQLAYNPGKSITEVALDCGFSSSSTFARAFKAFHGVSASQWRQNRNFGKPVRKNCKAQPAGLTASLIDESDPLRERAYTMNLKVSVRQVAPMNVAYLRHVGPFQENAALFERLLGRIRSWAEARGLLLPSASLLSISHDAPEITAAEKLRLDVALTVPEGTPVGGEIGGQRLEGGSYAVSRVRIRANQFMEAWDALMGGWLPGSGYQPDDRPRFEIYLNDPLADPERLLDVELCLAVKPL